MERVLPVLQIDDYESAVDFYVSRLGFQILMEHRHEPGFPVFMVVKTGALELALSEHGRGHEGTEVYLYVDDIEMWHRRCLKNWLRIRPETLCDSASRAPTTARIRPTRPSDRLDAANRRRNRVRTTERREQLSVLSVGSP